MNPGKLIRQVTYQTPFYARNAHNQKAPAGWTTVATLRCQVRPLNGREALVAGQFKGFVGHVLVHRWPGFMPDPTGRYVYVDRDSGTHVFAITHVLNVDQRNREINAYVTETVEPAQAP